MATSTSILLNAHPADALRLGWFVRNKYQPLETVHRTECEPTDIVKTEFTKVLDWRKEEDSQSLQAYLTGILGLSFGLKTGITADLKAASCTSYRVVNAQDWFENACSKKDLRMWLEKQMKTGGRRVRIWVIVGLLVVNGVKFNLNKHHGFKTAVDGSVPLSAFVGIPDPFLAVLVDPGAEISFVKDHESTTVFKTKSMIYAIQYRRLKLNLFKWPKIPSDLGPTSWQVMTTAAGSAEHKDVMGAQIGEEIDGMETTVQICDDEDYSDEDEDSDEDDNKKGEESETQVLFEGQDGKILFLKRT